MSAGAIGKATINGTMEQFGTIAKRTPFRVVTAALSFR
jgi:hypothetical protein